MASDTGRGIGLLVARLSMAALFWYTGLGSLGTIAPTAERLAAVGYPMPAVMAWVAAAAQIAGALSLTIGMLTPIGCLALILFLLPTTYTFHLLDALAGNRSQIIDVGKNLAIIGGLVAIMFTGPGRLSVDGRVMKGGSG